MMINSKIELSPEILKDIKNVISNMELNKQGIKAFVFGSRVTRHSSNRSDIDIGLHGKKRIPAIIKFELFDQLEKIPTLLKFDIVDFSIISSDVKNHVNDNVYYLN